jgi:hypothetical protein
MTEKRKACMRGKFREAFTWMVISGALLVAATVLLMLELNPVAKTYWVFSIVLALSSLCLALIRVNASQPKLIYYLEGSLDALELPITVTDMDMRWVFINKMTEKLLAIRNLDKRTVLGKHCSCWKADICGTEKCGIESLRKGIPRTQYMQEYKDQPSTLMQVDTSFIHDGRGRKIGHVEVVTNIDASNKLKKTTEQIAASLQETSASLQEMSATTTQTSRHAAQLNNTTNESAEVISRADESMTNLAGSMKEIIQASEDTSKIIRTIDEIAFQKNLLALNAAVEAARAGEAGAGFAVVADEVRNLAMRAAEASKSTESLIQRTIGKVREGSRFVEETGSSLSEVVATTAKAKTFIEEIAAGSKEQASGIEQIGAAVLEMEQAIQGVVQMHNTEAEKEPMRRAPVRVKAKVRKPCAIEIASSQRNGAGNEKTISPERLIPFEDDYQDF